MDHLTSTFTQIAERASESENQKRILREDLNILLKLNYFSASIPKDMGGWGFNLRECVQSLMELSQANSSMALVAAMPLQIMGHAKESERWSKDTYEKIATILTNGGLINSLASEPQLGSPSRGGLPNTHIIEEGGQLFLTGSKTWATGGEKLSHMLIRAKHNESPIVVLVENNIPGIEWHNSWENALSFRSSESNDVAFTRVPISPEQIIEKEPPPKAFNPWFPGLLSAVYLGAAIAARNEVIKYSLNRVPTALGKPISTLPSVKRQLGEIDMELQAAKLLLANATNQWAENWPTKENQSKLYAMVIAAKQFAVEAACNTTEKAIQIAGGGSATNALSLERHFRDVRAGRMHPPSGDAALEIIGANAIDSFSL